MLELRGEYQKTLEIKESLMWEVVDYEQIGNVIIGE